MKEAIKESLLHDSTIVGGTFVLVGFLMLMFAKFFPLIPVFDMKEGTRLRDTIRVGRRVVPASIRE